MSYYDAIILGMLQGFTEFLPVSSSGHLVLAQKLLGVKEAGVSLVMSLDGNGRCSIPAWFMKEKSFFFLS